MKAFGSVEAVRGGGCDNFRRAKHLTEQKGFVREILLNSPTKKYQVVEKYTHIFTTPPKRRILTRLLGGRIVVIPK